MEEQWREELQEVSEALDSLDANLEELNKTIEQLVYDAAFIKILVNMPVDGEEDWDYGES